MEARHTGSSRVLALGQACGFSSKLLPEAMARLLVQLASAADARVIGAARGAIKLEVFRELSVDSVVD